MKSRHKDKTLTCLLAVLLGWAGAHRFYLHGAKDIRAWAYVLASAIYVGIALLAIQTESIHAMIIVLLPLPILISQLEALVHGLVEDAKWDANYNAHSNRATRSKWPLVTLLVLCFACWFVALVTGMARATDLLYTGGSFG